MYLRGLARDVRHIGTRQCFCRQARHVWKALLDKIGQFFVNMSWESSGFFLNGMSRRDEQVCNGGFRVESQLLDCTWQALQAGANCISQSLLRMWSQSRDGFHISKRHLVAQTCRQILQQALPAFAFGLVRFAHEANDTNACAQVGNACRYVCREKPGYRRLLILKTPTSSKPSI